MRIEQRVTSDNVKYYVLVNNNDCVIDQFSNWDDAMKAFDLELEEQRIGKLLDNRACPGESDGINDECVDLDDYEF